MMAILSACFQIMNRHFSIGIKIEMRKSCQHLLFLINTLPAAPGHWFYRFKTAAFTCRIPIVKLMYRHPYTLRTKNRVLLGSQLRITERTSRPFLTAFPGTRPTILQHLPSASSISSCIYINAPHSARHGMPCSTASRIECFIVSFSDNCSP